MMIMMMMMIMIMMMMIMMITSLYIYENNDIINDNNHYNMRRRVITKLSVTEKYSDSDCFVKISIVDIQMTGTHSNTICQYNLSIT